MKNKMNKKWISGWLLVGQLLLFACYDETNTYGDNLVESAFRNVMVDTCTVTVTSTVIDSLETTGQGLALVGCYTHPSWGTVSASAYLPYATPSYNTDADETVYLDSLVLSLDYQGYSIGDTTQPMRLTVHRLQERIFLNDNGYLYNNSSFAYDPEPIASCTFLPRPGEGRKVEIRLPDELGEDLLERLHRRDDTMEDERFEQYFNGLVVVPDPTVCRSALAFSVGDSASALILHYRIEDAYAEESECVISPNTDKQFYHVDHDRSGTEMDGLPTKKFEVASADLGNRGVLFGGIGWYSRLQFPHLNNILELGERVSIESAYLRIYPEVGSWSADNPLPDSLYLYIVDENNVVTDAVMDYLGEEVQSGTLYEDDTYRENTYYSFDVSEFMQEELGASGQYKHGLQLVFNDDTYTQTFRNMTFNDQQSDYPIVLQLIFKVYESY